MQVKCRRNVDEMQIKSRYPQLLAGHAGSEDKYASEFAFFALIVSGAT
jgi:hypothetical protein